MLGAEFELLGYSDVPENILHACFSPVLLKNPGAFSSMRAGVGVYMNYSKIMSIFATELSSM
jgi:hypothetical protein